ncbi:hypothetical protein SPRG_20779 [Saprolegnia parasitica CBS 223.65]|uniref:Uncharacterized protein n=1 Tax=Saprolegnia parasitica (strain CBS 223.65) TaxID=695850 RepID=A0A067CEJ2_SAPPC|nr:hypothetical protein SPRG_20779 [Saprolegnia parasitica CBS 223.65]KDO25197.1 hypothetical protein SPRG_20779 [Saprolegnia parasitica CBS 223.65]|eukprot:XP_012204107.1 hypothetical protein SPRG_20779 [Saprolegnia parasitica CBS 223.65]
MISLSIPSPKALFTRWRRRSNCEDTKKLSPVALAGASRRYTSTINNCCNSHAPSVDPSCQSTTFQGDSKACTTCKRQYLRYASKYDEYCSVDCKSVGYSKYTLSY